MGLASVQLTWGRGSAQKAGKFCEVTSGDSLQTIDWEEHATAQSRFVGTEQICRRLAWMRPPITAIAYMQRLGEDAKKMELFIDDYINNLLNAVSKRICLM